MSAGSLPQPWVVALVRREVSARLRAAGPPLGARHGHRRPFASPLTPGLSPVRAMEPSRTWEGRTLRTKHSPTNRRRILCVFPRYSRVFGTFHHAYQFFPDVKAFMPPQGLLTIAAYLPESWEVEFVDENVREPTDDEIRWADAILVSSMHVQKRRVTAIAERAHAFGKVAVLGGPSVSAAPEYYPTYDYLHCGELGDATDNLVAMLDETVARPPEQIRLTTKDRVDLDDFPIPAYKKIRVSQYFTS